MKKEPKLFLAHIVESAADIENYTKKFSKEKFLKDKRTQDAIIRRIGIIGEAAKNVSSEIKKNSPNIPWKQITGMRDVLVHEYFGVRLERVWKTAKKDIPKLKKQVSELLENLG